MSAPTCPHCLKPHPLSPHGPVVAGSQWMWCTATPKWTPILVRLCDGAIIRTGKP